jgi:hypothetical protein
MADDFDSAIEANGRREFLKKLAIGTAFATPVVASFSMSGINAVYAQTAGGSGPGVQGESVTSSTTTTTTPNQTTTTTTLPNSTSPG